MKQFLSLICLLCFYSLSFASVNCSSYGLVAADDQSLTVNMPVSQPCLNKTFTVQVREFGSSGAYASPSFTVINNSGQLQALITGLNSCTDYEVFIRVFCNGVLQGGCNNITAAPFSTTGCAPCGPVLPADLSVVAPECDVIKISWPFNSADNYEIRWRLQGGTWNTPVALDGNTEDYVISSGVVAGATYEIELTAFCLNPDGTTTQYITNVFVTVPECPCGPIDAADVRAIPRGCDAIDLSWPLNGAFRYGIIWRVAGSSSSLGGTFVDGDVNNYRITGLTPGTTYEVLLRVFCFNPDGTASLFITSILVTVPECECGPIRSEEVEFTVKDCSTLLVDWPFNGAERYRISWRVAGQPWLGSVTLNNGESSLELTGLTPGQTYEIEIRTFCLLPDGTNALFVTTLTFTMPECEKEGDDVLMERSSNKSKETLQSSDFRVFPNPARAGGTLRINSDQLEGPLVISLVSISGQVIYQAQEVNNGEFTLPSDLATGIYILSIRAENTQHQTKLLVQ